MPEISTFVIFDIETTGLPHLEKNRTKITEACFLSVQRNDLKRAKHGMLPILDKLTFVLNPKRPIQAEVTKLTGITNDDLKFAPEFKNKFRTLFSFLADLPKPVCLVAHNGNTFDFKILLAECIDAKVSLPDDLYCLDSLLGFRKILKDNTIDLTINRSVKKEAVNYEEILTDDEDENNWPDLNVSHKEWEEIDEISQSLSDVSCEDSDTGTVESDKVINSVLVNKKRPAYNLTSLYEQLVGKEVLISHRAEADCLMLLECIVSIKDHFIDWAENNSKFLYMVKPLQRYNNNRRY